MVERSHNPGSREWSLRPVTPDTRRKRYDKELRGLAVDRLWRCSTRHNSRFRSTLNRLSGKAFDAMPDWVYRYVSAAAGDGRTQRANIDAYSRYGIIPRMMVSPPERDLSINLFGNHLPSPMFWPR